MLEKARKPRFLRVPTQEETDRAFEKMQILSATFARNAKAAGLSEEDIEKLIYD